ncbi:MAG: transcriptional activator RfaH [Gammaproteobacteria bacterium]|nr:transcriptional activator RfaH [Gammaproteobacteria bacterium]
MDRWYAVFAKPRQEDVAEEQLQRQNFTVWLPRLEHSVRYRGRWVDRIEPLFPRYLFLRADPGEQDLSTVRSTRGVTGLVRQGIEPAVVPEPVIEFLRANVDPETGLHRIGDKSRFKRGDRVKILEGPFEGLEGVLLKEKGEDRVIVLLAILGGQRNVALSAEQLARVAP